jgi:hypothetical protein
MLSAQPRTLGQGDRYEVAPLCTSELPSEGRAVKVSSGAELQNALDRAAEGDVILLSAGATFHAPAGAGFVLRRRPLAAGSWITIRSSDKAFDAGGTLPPSRRVDKANADLMPKLRSAGGPAITTDAGAHGYRLVGLDVGPDAAVSQLSTLVELGSGRDVSIEAEPSDIVIDRCYLHGNDGGNMRRGGP